MLTAGPTQAEAAIVAEHFDYLRRLTEAGVVRLAGRTTDEGPATLGIVILEADDKDAAQRLMDEDPAVSGGVMTATLQPFRIALQADPARHDTTLENE